MRPACRPQKVLDWGVEARVRDHLVPADFSLRHLDIHLHEAEHPRRRIAALLAPLIDSCDVVVIDCAPGITLTTESVFDAAHALLVPVVPSALSHRTLEQLEDFLRDRPDPPLVLPFASMVDRRKALHRQHLARLAEAVPEFLPTAIPDAAIVERMGTQRGPVAAYAPRAGVAIAYRHLWADIAARVRP